MNRNRKCIISIGVIGASHLVASVASLVAFEAAINGNWPHSHLGQKIIFGTYVCLTAPIRFADRYGMDIGDHWLLAFISNTVMFLAVVVGIWMVVGIIRKKSPANTPSQPIAARRGSG